MRYDVEYHGIVGLSSMKRFEDLFEDAEDSLSAAKDLFLTRRWSKVCFLAQQAAEVAVKGALNALGKETRGHDVHKLLENLGRYRKEVWQFIEEAKVLDQYYIPTRYMNAFAQGSAKSHFTERQAKEAIGTAEQILSEMRRISRG